MPELRVASSTDVGLVRGQNEDELLVSPCLWAVADGMGGHAAGEVAAALAIQALAELVPRRSDPPPDEVRSDEPPAALTLDQIEAAVRAANEAIVASGERHPEQAGMATTLTGLAIIRLDGTDRADLGARSDRSDRSNGADSLRWAVFNVGDSRVYQFAGGRLRQLTVDHSEVQELITSGALSPSQARSYRRRNVVTRSLGGYPPQPDTWVLPIQPNERFLLCSDGLTGELSDAAIADILSATPDPEEAVEALIAAAKTSGGRDNITVIVVDSRP
ncbi:MAG: Protein serine/threonine phosphatase [Frankiales bacterium]|nr:Protein serine/threonine phosphatase [Frankiales bacterium]